MFGIGFPEILLGLTLLLIFMGANRLPEMGRSLSDAMREAQKRDSDEPFAADSNMDHVDDKKQVTP